MFRHPDAAELRRFALHHESADGRAAVAEHLLRCARCRAEVARCRELRDALGEATAAPPTPDVLARVLDRRAAGERVILPAVAPPPARRRRWKVPGLAAAAAVFAGVVVMATLVAPGADAGESELRFAPARPGTGARVEVSYHPASLFAGADTLVLRGRLRAAGDVAYSRGARQRPVATLVRGRDGDFHGRFTLPDSVVYGIFAVEDRAGARIDHDGYRLWELEVHGRDGRPLFAALEQRVNDLHGRSWELMLETARRMTALYPEHPRGWALVSTLEQELAAPAARDSVARAYRARLEALHAALAPRRAVPADVAGALATHHAGRAVHQYWRGRLVREHPLDPFSVFVQQDGMNRAHRDSARWGAYLDEVEGLWTRIAPRAGPGHAFWFHNPLAFAELAGDDAALLRWTERLLRHRPVDGPEVVHFLDGLARRPALRPRALGMMRGYLAAWRRPDDAGRALPETRAEHAARARKDARALLAALGSALVAGGDTAAGLDTLRLAAAEGWDPGIFAAVAHASLAAGDTTAALRHFALLAAEPGAEAYADSARARGGRRFRQAEWAAWVAAARARLGAETLAEATVRTLRGGVEVADAAGRPRPLAELLGGRPAVITFWSRGCGPSLRELAQVEQLYHWLRDEGVGFVALSDDHAPADAVKALRENGATFPSWFDTRGEARDALNKFSTPAYWVVDASGRIIFDQTDLRSVRRQVAALLAASPGGAPGP